MEGHLHQIVERYQQVVEQIAAAEQRAGRRAGEVRLVVVTKTHPVEAVQAVIDAGAHILGENYPEEALSKINKIASIPDLQWHMIGHVQSRKSNLVSTHFDYLHSLDSLKLAARLNRQASAAGRILPVLVECNVSQEESKYGFSTWDERAWPTIIEELSVLANFSALSVRGLMTMAPYSEDPQSARPYYSRLRKLQETLARALPFSNWEELSMGMSGDFEVAIEEGTSWVRIGTRIMGERQNFREV